jgi:hypothetical protein
MSRASSVGSVWGLTEGTPAGATPPNCPSALYSSKYPTTLPNGLPTVDQDKAVHRASMFSLSHRVAPGGKGNFWFLQVGIKYLDDQDSRATMFLGLLSLMDILPGSLMGLLCTHLTNLPLSLP